VARDSTIAQRASPAGPGRAPIAAKGTSYRASYYSRARKRLEIYERDSVFRARNSADDLHSRGRLAATPGADQAQQSVLV
jgi:hypothetical protein